MDVSMAMAGGAALLAAYLAGFLHGAAVWRRASNAWKEAARNWKHLAELRAPLAGISKPSAFWKNAGSA